MTHSFPCQHCDFAFPVEDEDRGLSVYCPSCGRECQVPKDFGQAKKATADKTAGDSAVNAVADSAGPSGQSRSKDNRNATADAALSTPGAPVKAATQSGRRVSVFARDGATRVLEKEAGELICLCGEGIPVTVGDYGTTVYCPSCGSGLPVGERLQKVVAARVSTTVDEPAVERTPVLVSHLKLRLFVSRTALVVLLCLVTSAGVGAFVTWKHPEMLPERIRVLVTTDPAPKVGPKSGDTFADDGDEPPPRLEITLEEIEALLQVQDARMALIDAQLWQQVLKDDGVSEDDPRSKRLEEVIDLLMKRLSPRTKPRTGVFAEFRGLLNKLRDALKSGRLDRARTIHRQAHDLYGKHAAQLATLGGAFAKLEARLRELEYQVEGIQQIEKLLNLARKQARDGKPTEAMKSRAQGLNKAYFYSSMSDAEIQKLEKLVDSLKGPILLARGRKAVADAETCQRKYDRVARDRELRLAQSVLPGLPEDSIKDLVSRVEKLKKQPIANARSTAYGHELKKRHDYEDALIPFGRGNTKQLVNKCLEAEEEGSTDKRLIALVFDAIEPRLADLMAHFGQTPDGVGQLAEIRRTLNRLTKWKYMPRWKAVNASLQQQIAAIAMSRLDGAKRLADKEQFQEAVTAAGAVIDLGEASSAAKARELQREWRNEVKLRADKRAQEEHYMQIQQLAQAGEILQATREIAAFQKRFNTGPRVADVAALLQDLQVELTKIAARAIQEAESFYQMKKWPQFRKKVEELKGVPISSAQQPQFDNIRNQAEALIDRANGLYQQAKAVSSLQNEEQILIALDVLPKVLELDPDHADAAAMLKMARREGKEIASTLLKKAKPYYKSRNKRLRTTGKRYLEKVVKLDPDGVAGKEARTLLKKR